MTEQEYSAALPIDEIETIAGNSFRNFHAKGLDYLCLKRTANLTLKAYFYSRPDDAGSEVVCPHDHRYPFVTKVLTGKSGHLRYLEPPPWIAAGLIYQCFNWRTPLNGGEGFEWSREARLQCVEHETHRAGDSYFCQPDDIHTITIQEPDTVLLLYQLADRLPIDCATSTFVPGSSSEPPSLAGLYDKMTVDRARELLAHIARLNGEAAHG